MDYGIEIKTTLITDNGKRFNCGSDIAFKLLNEKTSTYDRYIGRIREIKDSSMIIEDIEINRGHIDGPVEIRFENIVKNSCNYVSYEV